VSSFAEWKGYNICGYYCLSRRQLQQFNSEVTFITLGVSKLWPAD